MQNCRANILVQKLGRALALTGFFCLIICVLTSYSNVASAENAQGLKRFFPKAFANSVFDEKKAPVKIDDASAVVQVEEVNKNSEDTASQISGPTGVEFQTSDVRKKTFLPPDQTPPVAINPNAPSSAISMIESNRSGDRVTAKKYAKQFVRVLQNYFFEIREITSLIGEALIEERVVKQEDWIGAEQAIDIELAKTRLERGAPIKPTHDVAMRRVVPDPKKEVEVFFFFSRTCSYCRYMATDVERLARAFKADSRVKLTALAVGDMSQEWLDGYREHTGLSLPVFDGSEFAAKLNIGFLPVLLLVEPNGERSYYKTGQQTFETMYEFVRTAQGLKTEDNSYIQEIIRTPIGERERLLINDGSKNSLVIAQHFGTSSGNRSTVRMPNKTKSKTVEVDAF